jgi:hypothetical protein
VHNSPTREFLALVTWVAALLKYLGPNIRKAKLAQPLEVVNHIHALAVVQRETPKPHSPASAAAAATTNTPSAAARSFLAPTGATELHSPVSLSPVLFPENPPDAPPAPGAPSYAASIQVEEEEEDMAMAALLLELQAAGLSLSMGDTQVHVHSPSAFDASAECHVPLLPPTPHSPSAAAAAAATFAAATTAEGSMAAAQSSHNTVGVFEHESCSHVWFR